MLSVEIAQVDTGRGIFHDGYKARQVLDAIMTEPREALMYLRQRQRIEVVEAEEHEEANEL